MLKMNLQIELKNGVMTALITGELDHHTAGILREQIDTTAERVRPKVLRLDFSEVPFMDSSGIAVVINAMRSMAQIEGRLILSGIGDQPMKVFRASGMDKLVDFKEASV